MKYVFLLVILSYQVAMAQTLTREQVQGKWTCQEVKEIEKEITADMKPMIESMKKGFLSSTFHFRTDDIFVMQLSKDAPPVMKEMLFVNNQKWHLFPNERKITIGDPKENLMHIFVKNINGEVIFLLEDFPLMLIMKKNL